MVVNSFYTKDFYESLKESSRRSALEIVPLILELIQPKSVVDVGCGLGTWLSVFKEFGVKDCLGIDGDYVDKKMLQIPQEEFLSCDLTNPLQIDKKFDLVISLEVAEHLPAECAEIFIDSLTRLGSVVLFSAAIPFQGGTGHFNEQWPHYWVKYFRKNKYSVIDCLRKVIWNNEKAEPWYAQNMLFFVRDDSIKKYPLLKRERRNTFISQLAIVHPKIYRESVMEIAAESLPRTVEDNYVIRVEITEPIGDIFPPAIASRLVCIVELEGSRIGKLELPICDRIVSSYVLTDAIAAEFAWSIIGRFFERTVYRNLNIKRRKKGLSINRENLCLVSGLQEGARAAWEKVHEHVGWTVFLQEFWGRSNWPRERFYDPEFAEDSALIQRVDNGWLMVEISNDLPDIEVSDEELDIVPMVGGVALGIVTISVKHNIVQAQELRVAITSASGYELCRVAVREGLLGRPIAEVSSLRNRLATAATESAQQGVDDLVYTFSKGITLAPGSARVLKHALFPNKKGIILGRHLSGAIKTNASRRAALPAAAVHDLINTALVTGQPVIHMPRKSKRPGCVIYSPDLVWRQPKHGYGTSLEKSVVVQTNNFNVSDQSQNEINVVTDRVPILLYHRVTSTDSHIMSDYVVTSDIFEKQLRYLHDAGFYSVRLEDWGDAMIVKRPFPGRAVIITFDDGYLDFLRSAWPILKQYGFSATVFLVTDKVGKINDWDNMYREQSPLLGWDEIRALQAEGVEFGSHSASHPYLTKLSAEEIVREGARSRAILGRELGLTVNAFAYPYGDVDHVVQHLIGACGYIFGLSCRKELSSYYDPLLSLPRLEVFGSDTLQEFVAMLNVCSTHIAG